MLAAAGNGAALWYLTRSTGIVTLLLLTATLVLGVVEVNRWTSPRWPRFVTAALHKNLSLLALALLAIHIVTSVVDSYAPIRWLDVVVPFGSPYRPIWLGLGALALDLSVALVLTSLVRDRIGVAAWRLVHWAAYAVWPISVVHGLGTGTDTQKGWALAVYGGCLAAVVMAVVWRISCRWTVATPERRAGVCVAVVATVLVIGAFALAGPLRRGWAARAGTPSGLLHNATVTTSTGAGP